MIFVSQSIKYREGIFFSCHDPKFVFRHKLSPLAANSLVLLKLSVPATCSDQCPIQAHQNLDSGPYQILSRGSLEENKLSVNQQSSTLN